MGSQFLRFYDSFFWLLLKRRTKIFVKENNKDLGNPEVQKIEIIGGRKEGRGGGRKGTERGREEREREREAHSFCYQGVYRKMHVLQELESIMTKVNRLSLVIRET